MESGSDGVKRRVCQRAAREFAEIYVYMYICIYVYMYICRQRYAVRRKGGQRRVGRQREWRREI
jgi:hypothetical protein